MSAKTLSNGTLSLRFMQNAQRAKQQSQVQLEEANINDDAEWHVSQEVRDSWRSGSYLNSERFSVTQEPSYLPFLFAREAPNEEAPVSTSGYIGRRSFKRGKEVASDETPVPKLNEPLHNAAPTTTEPQRPKRPVSISGFKSRPPANSKTPQVAARSLIAQDADVGTDMKSSRRRAPAGEPVVADVKTGFVKPSGVDTPPVQGAGPVGATQSRAESILSLAKSQMLTNLKKRGREDGVPISGVSTPARDEGQEDLPKKRKKKVAARGDSIS